MQPDFLAVAQADEHSLARELTISSDTSVPSGPPVELGAPELASDHPPVPDSRIAQVGKSLLTEIGQRNFRHWFAGRTSITIDDNCIRVGVGGSFLLTWMQRRFGADVVDAVRRVIPEGVVEWSVIAQAGTLSLPDDLASEAGNRSESEGKSSAQGVSTAAPRREDSARTTSDLCVSPEGSLQQLRRDADSCSPAATDRAGSPHELRRFRDLSEFVAGPCNELAITAARQVAQLPGDRYSPLFLHGGVGTGKTHLAEGIYREVRRTHSGLRTVFMTSEQFTNQFTSALRSHTLPAFRQRFRSVDVLIVDDVGFLGGKRAIQEEFLHTFKQLESHGRQVVVTCDTHPRLMTGASEELISRFLCGLVCRLENPDTATRRKIVQARAEMLAAEFDTAALDYISRRFVTSVRELEGALNTLETWHSMTGRRVTLNAAKTVLADLERDCVRAVKLPEIEAAVSSLFALQQSDLKSGRRTKAVTQPRMLAMFLARRHTQAAYKEIGEFFGGRNHSTVIAAEKKVEGWLQADEELKIGGRSWQLSDLVETLEQQLMAG
jgi:chromosomal replication initiator protein